MKNWKTSICVKIASQLFRGNYCSQFLNPNFESCKKLSANRRRRLLFSFATYAATKYSVASSLHSQPVSERRMKCGNGAEAPVNNNLVDLEDGRKLEMVKKEEGDEVEDLVGDGKSTRGSEKKAEGELWT